MQDPPPQPDSRTASTTPSDTVDLSNIIKNEQFWFEDGDIVLLCDSIGFRVSRHMLESLSPVLKNIFANNELGAGNEGFEGCTVVRLDDDAGDVQQFLFLTYFNQFSLEERFSRIDSVRSMLRMETMQSMLRLERKYKVEQLNTIILDHLKYMFPSTLAAYRAQKRSPDMFESFNPMLGVDIALEFDIPAILPMALYMSALLPLDTKLSGYKQADGKIYIPPMHVLRAIMIFQERMQEEIDARESLTGWFEPKCCRVDGDCDGLDRWIMVALRRWYRDFRRDIFRDDFDADSNELFHETCEECVLYCRESETKNREKLWELLPTLHFGSEATWETISPVAVAQGPPLPA
ncbi:hypothetical protein BV25DRAFT_1915998 [Artomyces pyxidatus]|uniref:Uncharacterized protein n=1 Tax=Artomyces pyxidatus TaxID=48021 RepID=A0ACB8T390_9AGAM|nr:hypothetical protein BV25DRAFT_1915998 [Artomyces pyxidatus]